MDIKGTVKNIFTPKLVHDLDPVSWKEFRVWCVQHDAKIGVQLSNIIRSFLKQQKRKEGKKK